MEWRRMWEARHLDGRYNPKVSRPAAQRIPKVCSAGVAPLCKNNFPGSQNHLEKFVLALAQNLFLLTLILSKEVSINHKRVFSKLGLEPESVSSLSNQ